MVTLSHCILWLRNAFNFLYSYEGDFDDVDDEEPLDEVNDPEVSWKTTTTMN